MFSHSLALLQALSPAQPEPWIGWDVMKVLLPGSADRAASESQTRLGAGLEQILSCSHKTDWESLGDPQSIHEETPGTASKWDLCV